MLLAINIGNTNIRFGIFDNDKLMKTYIIPTKESPDIKTEILRFTQNDTVEKTVIASVVPTKNKDFNFLSPVFIHELVDLGEVGADIYCGVVASSKLHGGPGVVVDLGTATTLNAYDKSGKLLGVVIAPGLQTAHHALIEKTALLHPIELKAPASAIGTDTTTAIQSGVLLGHISMIEGMIQRFKNELGDLKIIATGGLCKIVEPYTKVFDTVDTNLVLKGIQILAG